jgi:2-polyprenyl-3-methyl-5-hydroxy-6-metoxy-1,4-benzoquinol methylase
LVIEGPLPLRDVTVDEIDRINGLHDREVDRVAALCEVYVRPPERIILSASKVDPFEPKYINIMRDWLNEITGKSYEASVSERSDYLEEQVTSDTVRFGLYRYDDSRFVGELLQSYGGVLKALNVRSGQSVLEYGPGEGQISLNLAQMGCRVVVTDIERRYLSLIERQAAQLHTTVKTIYGQFGDAEPGTTYDRILFFEAFHHALNHHELLPKLKAQLSPGGFLVFAGEPIMGVDHYFRPVLPYAWGPRLDGLSMRAMRTYGWCELGFTREYFVELLMRNGFLLEYRPDGATERASAYLAKRADKTVNLGSAIMLESADHPNCWHNGEGEIRWSRTERAAIPLDCSSGWRTVTLGLRNYMPLRRQIIVTSGDASENLVMEAGQHAQVTLPVSSVGRLEVSCPTLRPCDVIAESTDDRDLGIAVANLLYEA